MSLLYTLCDIYLSGFRDVILNVLSIIALSLGIAVIINKNPIWSLMYLIGLFGSISVYLILVGLTFIGFSYLIVYIGAVSILFLFILMLINIRTSEIQSNNWNSIPLALSVSTLLNYTLHQLLPYYIAILNGYGQKIKQNLYYLVRYNDTITNIFNKLEEALATFNTQNTTEYYVNENTSPSTKVMYVTSNNWDGNMTETSHISSLGNILYTSYNIWLLIVSIILILVMIGSIIITIEPRVNENNMKKAANCASHKNGNAKI